MANEELQLYIRDHARTIALLDDLLARCNRMIEDETLNDDQAAYWMLRRIRAERALNWLGRFDRDAAIRDVK